MSHSALVFLHANGFPAGSYRQFLSALESQARVIAPPAIETPADMEGRRRWSRMLHQAVAEVRQAAERHGPVALVGHSMGGYLSLLTAARLPAHVRDVVLVDSPIVTGWRKSVFETLRFTGLSRRGGPAPVAARRRDRWDSLELAHDYFAGKAMVRHWAPGVLEDFLACGLATDDGGNVSLRIAREAERDIYAYVPTHRAWQAYQALRARGTTGLHMITGTRSREMELAGRGINRRLFGADWHELPTGHLIPLEQPLACAEKVAACLGITLDDESGFGPGGQPATVG